jgi:hypothetical protein
MIFVRHMFTRLLAFDYIQQTGLAIDKWSNIENPVGASPIDHLIPHRNLMEDDYLIDLLEACSKRVRNKLRHSCGTLRFVRIKSISLVVQSLDLVQTLTFDSFLGRSSSQRPRCRSFPVNSLFCSRRAV